MKTIEQIQSETFGHVYTIEEFAQMVEDGLFIEYDGSGCFHDGEKETNISVWDDTLTWEDVKDYPYVIWYNR